MESEDREHEYQDTREQPTETDKDKSLIYSIQVDSEGSGLESRCRSEVGALMNERRKNIMKELNRKSQEPLQQNAREHAKNMISFVEGLIEKHLGLSTRMHKRAGKIRIAIEQMRKAEKANQMQRAKMCCRHYDKLGTSLSKILKAEAQKLLTEQDKTSTEAQTIDLNHMRTEFSKLQKSLAETRKQVSHQEQLTEKCKKALLQQHKHVADLEKDCSNLKDQLATTHSRIERFEREASKLQKRTEAAEMAASAHSETMLRAPTIAEYVKVMSLAAQ